MQKQSESHMSVNTPFLASKLRQSIIKEIFALSALGQYHKDQVYLALQYNERYWNIQFHSDAQQTWIDPHVRAATFCCMNLALKMCHEFNHSHPFEPKNKIVGSSEESQTTRRSILDLEFHVLNILQWNLYVSPHNNLLQLYNRFYFCVPLKSQQVRSADKLDLCLQTYLYVCDVLWSMAFTSIPTIAAIAFLFAYQEKEKDPWFQAVVDRYGTEIDAKVLKYGMQAIEKMNILLPDKPNVWSLRMDSGGEEWTYQSLKQRKYNWIYKEIPDIGNVFVPILTHEDTIT